MALAMGEYAFTCRDCDGSGEIEIGPTGDPNNVRATCDDCEGSGEVVYEEDEAEECIELRGGEQPLWVRLASD